MHCTHWMKRVLCISLVFLLTTFLVPNKAEAYIDPGSGSYFLQILIAGLLGALYGLKVFWFRIVDFFKVTFTRKKN